MTSLSRHARSPRPSVVPTQPGPRWVEFACGGKSLRRAAPEGLRRQVERLAAVEQTAGDRAEAEQLGDEVGAEVGVADRRERRGVGWCAGVARSGLSV